MGTCKYVNTKNRNRFVDPREKQTGQFSGIFTTNILPLTVLAGSQRWRIRKNRGSPRVRTSDRFQRLQWVWPRISLSKQPSPTPQNAFVVSFSGKQTGHSSGIFVMRKTFTPGQYSRTAN